MQLQFQSWAEFWAMGGYGVYVWLAFGVTFGALVLIVIDSINSKKSALKSALVESERKQRIKAARQAQPQSLQEAQSES